MLGNRLKLARAAAGLSLRDLSERMNQLVSAQALGKYERDEMLPSSPVLIALAKALKVSEAYLLSSGEELELAGVEFRKQKLATARDEAALKAQVLNRAERYLQIEDILAAESTDWKPPANFPRPVSSVDEAELAAQKLRDTWLLGEDPIPKLAEFLEERGIKVLAFGLADSISGMTAKIGRKGGRFVPVIVINANHPGERQRFTLAHELGHLVLEPAKDVDFDRAADRFAGAFLVPAAALLPEVGRRRHEVPLGELLRLKRLFLASMQCLIYRLRDLGVITPTLCAVLFARMSKLNIRMKEPEELPHEVTARFERLVFRSLAEELISESKAAELLDVTVRELSSMAELDAAV